ANSLSDDISILNSQTLSLAYTLPAGSFPAAIEFAESQKAAYVANMRSGFITQINSQQIAVSSQLNLSRGISDIAADAFTGTLYCAIESMDYISIFKPSLNIELTQIAAGRSPRRVAFDPQGRLLYVCCSGSNEVSVINKVSGRAERVIAAGQNPFMIVFP
ncbi:MAG TPA: YncE family protein, partial [bacterium]